MGTGDNGGMIQRFSIAKLFLFIAFAALGSLTVRQAFAGADWAKAVSLVIVAALVWLGIHMLLGAMGYLMMRILQLFSPSRAQSPFATDVPAQQIIPPKNIDSQ